MDSEAVKNEVIRQVRTEYAMDNVKQLVEKINKNCFERCIPKPGTSLSSGEQTCVTQCIEKYMSGWNQVSAACIGRIRDPQRGEAAILNR